MTRTYVITGSASGIGAATARILKEKGARVIGVDLKDAEIEADLGTRKGRAAAAAHAVKSADGVIHAVITDLVGRRRKHPCDRSDHLHRRGRRCRASRREHPGLRNVTISFNKILNWR